VSGDVLAGRVAIVTGGGRGLGRALALALAGAGADVVVAARGAEELTRVADEVRALGRGALAVPTDVTVAADAERLATTAVAELGRLDILVNNAGVLHGAPLLETRDEDWDRVVDTNLRGTFLCTRAAGRHLTAAGAGKVINVVSNFALRGVAGYASYCASKAGIAGLTRAVAVEWAPHNVQVNAVAAGYFETEINADARADPQLYDYLLRQIPARRMGQPEELGPLVVFLASSGADFMTGETVVIDGGQVIR
jgi:2-deoxy-D-gluconate 3-dehydrogenase